MQDKAESHMGNNVIKMISVLTIIGIISGLMLAVVYNYANPLIIENQKREEIDEGVFKIFPEGKNCETIGTEDEGIFKVTDKNGEFLGYTFTCVGNGYQGAIKLMAGIKPDLETLQGIEILESQETPGLGLEIAQDKFKIQFRGLKTVPEIVYVKNEKPTKPNEIEAITGATVSSSAVVLILNEGIKKIGEKVRPQ